MLKQPVRTSLSDFIKTTMGSQFVIPVYQRNYTWNPEKETARYMSDLESLLNGKIKNHFLGIIIYKESVVSTMFRQLQIIDGQQRLTTSFIFLLALKKVALDQNEKVTAEMVDDYYLYNRHTIEEAKLRLKPTVSNDDVYAKLVYGNEAGLAKKDKESSVYRNYEYILQRIHQMTKSHSLLEILDVLAKVDILEFPLSETDNAQQIFESINSTGAPLTSADLIRNYILMNHTNDVQERYYKLYWAPLEQYYPESRKLEEFFRCYLAVKTYSLLSRRDVYEGFKEYWQSLDENAEENMKDIDRYCRYMYEIYNGPAEGKLAEEALSDFRKSESRLPAPFLMEMYHLYDTSVISEREFTALVRLIDSYMIRRALCGNDTGSLSRYFPTLLRSVMTAFHSKKKQDIITLTKVNLINYNRGRSLAMPTDDQLRLQLREINAYSLMCIRTVLERIEHYGSHAKVDTSELNIEHIMPQNPNAWWRKHSGTENEDDYTSTVNLIGNLTLCAVYDNSKMGNENFSYKKKILAQTAHIRLNTSIIQEKEWNKQTILERCDEMAEKIIQIYPYGTGRQAYTIKNNDMIVLSAPSTEARGLLTKDGKVKVMTGSVLKAYGSREMKVYQKLYQDMYDRGILKDSQDGKIEFVQNYTFTDLNTAAGFLMHRGGDNAGAWKYEDGSQIQAFEQAEKNEELPAPKNTKKTDSTEKKENVKTKKKGSKIPAQKKESTITKTKKSGKKKSSANKKETEKEKAKTKRNTKKETSEKKISARQLNRKQIAQPEEQKEEQKTTHYIAPARVFFAGEEDR